MNRPCLDCGQLVNNASRCPTCQQRVQTALNARPKRRKPHHTDPGYRRRSAALRAEWNANPFTRCWICGELSKGGGWTADHVIPGDLTSPLAPAHLSCNSSRGNRWQANEI